MGMLERVTRWTERWLPKGVSEEVLTASRFVMRAWAIAIPAVLLSIVIYVASGAWGQAAASAVLVVGGVTAIVWLRRTGALLPVTHFSLAMATLSFAGSTLGETPADITNTAFLAILPLVATLLMPRRHARVWLYVPMVTAIALVVVADAGFSLPITDDTPVLTHAMNLGLLMLVVWAFSRTFGAVREDALQKARDADRAKSTFLATVSHEIRTPMNAILGMTELVLGDELTPTQRGRLEVVQRAGGLLVSLVNDVLDVMKIEARKLHLEETSFDPRALVRDVVVLHRSQADARGLRCEVELDPALPALVRGDPLRLTQILGNLVSNAVKFTERGGVTVRVEGDGDARVRFTVEDTGPGIAPDVLETLFTRFQQAAAWTTRRHGGTGLGLALAKELVELMGGGSIEVRSEVGRGTRMTFAVPLPATREPARATPRQGSPRPEGLRVLVVDDNPLNVAVVQGLLERAGCRVDAVGNGQDALARAATETYALVFMDLYMPEMDGIEVTRRLREPGSRASATPIVGLTASALPEELAACRAVGMVDVLVKPVSPAHLRAALAHATPSESAKPGGP